MIVTGPGGAALGSFRSKAISLGGAFFVLDASGQTVAEIKGDWKGWNFRFLDTAGRELGTVTKQWAGIGKELFTSADTYLIALSDAAPRGANQVALLLAAGLAIDVVFKEKK
ncbi:MAG: phospholipid scramblase-related protein [Thermoanaerobaculia bacterium]|nr:phospholipid scramblase-related protein [Thermoanaerobaculia bacterium]